MAAKRVCDLARLPKFDSFIRRALKEEPYLQNCRFDTSLIAHQSNTRHPRSQAPPRHYVHALSAQVLAGSQPRYVLSWGEYQLCGFTVQEYQTLTDPKSLR